MSKETVDGGPSTVDERGAAGQGGEPADRGVVGDAPGARSIASAELGLDPLGDRIPRGPGEGAAPIARPRGAEARLTASGALVGTPAYMAPEQLDGGEADARSDLFSFCAALYEALHGRRPFDGADAAALRRAIAAGVDPRPPALEVPRGVHEAILRGLAEDPGARWPTMDALLVALRRRPERARRRAWIGAVLLVLSLGTCLFGYLECVARRAADHDEDLGRARARVQAAESARRSADEAAARASASDLARRLVAASSAAARRDPEAGILYAIEAWTASQGAGASVQGEAEEALRDALDAVKGAPLVDPEGHAGLRAAALAADGRWAATRDADGVLRLWAIDAGAPQLRARIPGAPERAPLVFAGAGVLVTLGPDGGVETVSASRPRFTGGPAPAAPIEALVPAPDGREVLVIDGRGAALHEVDGATARPLVGLRGHVQVARFSPDGELVATVTDDGTAQLWSRRDGRAGARLRGPTRGRGRVGAAWSPVGDRLALIGPDALHVVGIRGGRARRLGAADEELLDATFTADGVALLSLDVDGIVRRYGDDGPLARVELIQHDEAVGGARFIAGDELLLGTPFGGAIWLWSAADRGAPRVLRGHASSVTLTRVSDDGARILSIAHDDPRARLWRLGDDPAVRRGHEGLIERLRWRGDGGALVSAAMDGTARVWPREGGAPVVLRRHAEGSTVVAELRGDGRLIATASTDGSARVWRLGAGDPAPIAALGPPSGRPGRGPPAALVDVAWSPGGARVAVAGEDGALRLWPVGDEGPSGPLTSLSLGTGPISHVRWIDDERLLVADGEAQLLRVEAPAGGEPVASRLAVHGAEIRDLAVAPGGRRAASVGVDGRALVLDLVGEAPPRALEHGGATLWALDFDAAGARLVTAVDDGSAWIWELDAAGSEPVVLRGHREGVLAVDFAPSGDAVVTGGADGEARLWRKRQVSEDMSEWTSVRLPHAGTGWPGDRERSVWTVAFSPDGAQVATGAADGALRIFPVEADALIAEACERVGRDLRDDERARVELGPTAPRCRRP